MKINQVNQHLIFISIAQAKSILFQTENYQKAGKGAKNKKLTETTTDKEFKELKQRPNETDTGFMRRVNRVTYESVEEAKFEAKYGVEVMRDTKTGEIKLKKKPRNEIDERLKQNAENQKRIKKGGKAIPAPLVLAPEERKKLVKAMLAEKKQKKESETKEAKIEEYKYDEVKFGEVVNAPPQLTAPRLGKKAETVPRVRELSSFFFKFIHDQLFCFQPGKKSLLLHSVIDEFSSKDEPVVEKIDDSKSPKTIQNPKSKDVGTLKGKRKDLSMAMRYMIDTEQENVVKLYKELKKSQRLLNAKK